MVKRKEKSNATAVLIQRLVMMLFFLFGLALLVYPLISQGINDYLDQRTVQKYQREASKKNKAEIEKLQKQMAAQDEKAKKEKNPGSDGEPFSQQRRNKEKKPKPTQSYVKEHTTGTIIIPKIDVKLPIFDVTNDFFLSKGATVLEGTSSINGGESSHSVISSHRGLKKAKLFTDLPKLKKQDQFYLEVLNETHAYEVDQIKVIEPTETKDLLIVEGMDYVTLMTCTPYGVNSHRLLVRGHRIPYTKAMAKKKAQVDERKKFKQLLMLTAVILGTLLILWIFYRIVRTAVVGRRKYQLAFYLLDQTTKQPITEQEVHLSGRRGKNPIIFDGKPLVVLSDSTGKVTFPPLFGKVYGLKFSEGSSVFAQTKVKRIKAINFSLKPKSKKVVINEADQLSVFRGEA
ncbi:class C sortase [Enterococcus hulanensis]|uniref:Class C sortase n=1 Tax=Enterococcus hulanensis TaxID=2559929 RepID=A0ABU3F0H8_9ENTE|nr:class C sortase [Enterococcus hulanensis]MDT2600637.1 class C sortase [Enterococcus hulanensis]MDT2610160.1 class C sortase [Enterococcus hulanensis]MDT2617432.1 class C sortase [Enterococcus hulanensis]MDT2628105.1 class C sortase [Enterococcus hulanensis]MDT2655210.1 class C sortase [Enterococcus hulanensis]